MISREAPAQPLVETETRAGLKARGPGSKRKVYIPGPAEFLTCKFFFFSFILTRGHFSIFCSDRAGGRERKRERNIDVKGHIEWLPPARPTRAGDKLQPRYVPLAGTEPGSLRTAGRCSNR
uniref:Uncharacterized protein n=1 Tax=Molossus molossus TaxID=27622 RepID=A0A7J8GRD4_MOLMO|nr:hypothetical protein HJG59_011233 [Molossus molossus]